jgi:hypothetical protein
LVEIFSCQLSLGEQAEYRKTLPDFTLKIKDRSSNSTKKDWTTVCGVSVDKICDSDWFDTAGTGIVR